MDLRSTAGVLGALLVRRPRNPSDPPKNLALPPPPSGRRPPPQPVLRRRLNLIVVQPRARGLFAVADIRGLPSATRLGPPVLAWPPWQLDLGRARQHGALCAAAHYPSILRPRIPRRPPLRVPRGALDAEARDIGLPQTHPTPSRHVPGSCQPLGSLRVNQWLQGWLTEPIESPCHHQAPPLAAPSSSKSTPPPSANTSLHRAIVGCQGSPQLSTCCSGGGQPPAASQPPVSRSRRPSPCGPRSRRRLSAAPSGLLSVEPRGCAIQGLCS